MLAAAACVVVVVCLLGFGAWILFMRPPSPGTPELSPEVEALRDEASTYELQRPVHTPGWTLVLTEVDTEVVWVSFVREGASAVEVSVEVGSSQTVADCTITVLESYPGRSGGRPGDVSGSALIAVRCPAPEGGSGSPAPSGEGAGTPTG